MFDEVTRNERGRRAATRAGFVLGSAAVQGLLFAGIVAASAALREEPVHEPAVPVVLVRPSAPAAEPIAPPPPPPAPPAAATSRRPEGSDLRRPRPAERKPPAPVAIRAQTETETETDTKTEVEAETETATATATETTATETTATETTATETTETQTTATATETEMETEGGEDAPGAIAGVAGGLPGGDPEGRSGGLVGGIPGGVDDAPAYPAAGYRQARPADPGCVGRNVRIPRDLAGFASGPITVKFAVGRDGAPSHYDLVTAVPDRRIARAIWDAIQACRWIPGTDAQGNPAWLWVFLPIRFTTG